MEPEIPEKVFEVARSVSSAYWRRNHYWLRRGMDYEDVYSMALFAGYQVWEEEGFHPNLGGHLHQRMQWRIRDGVRYEYTGKPTLGGGFARTWPYERPEPDVYQPPQIESGFSTIEARLAFRQIFALAETPMERDLLESFLKEETLACIGKRYGVTESRICQIKKNLFERLRQKILALE